mmetsp:Transcript_42202/g.101552  ORF Transcript_42202/g.101552 Transcript_42202/m.101552 type:complete len:266 (+) Transcript_42202:1945-2742(+)
MLSSLFLFSRISDNTRSLAWLREEATPDAIRAFALFSISASRSFWIRFLAASRASSGRWSNGVSGGRESLLVFSLFFRFLLFLVELSGIDDEASTGNANASCFSNVIRSLSTSASASCNPSPPTSVSQGVGRFNGMAPAGRRRSTRLTTLDLASYNLSASSRSLRRSDASRSAMSSSMTVSTFVVASSSSISIGASSSYSNCGAGSAAKAASSSFLARFAARRSSLASWRMDMVVVVANVEAPTDAKSSPPATTLRNSDCGRFRP